MTAKVAEITFEVDPPTRSDEAPQLSWVCRRCFSAIRHNVRLRLSFCPVHGLCFELAPRGPGPVRPLPNLGSQAKRARGD